jgi:hypothetical protein
MPTFPFTFPYAGRTFSVVSDGRASGEMDRADSSAGGPHTASDGVYVRIIGIRGLHDFGSVEPSESNGRLRERICRWYDDTYLQPVGQRSGASERS